MITTNLLKYILRGALRGIEEYEAMLQEEHVDSSGKLGQLLDSDKKKSTSDEMIDFDELLKDS